MSGLTTSPGSLEMTSVRPSRCFTANLNPHSASTRVMSFLMKRSSPLRLKVSCGFSWITNTMSPGTMSGASSPSPWNVIFWLLAIPFSTTSSITFFSCTTWFARHCVHLSLALTPLPLPLQSPHTDCICWTMPGPIWRSWIFTPWPWQPWHSIFFPLLEPVPLHLEHSTFLERLSFLVTPLYRSSSDTFIAWTTSSPLRCLWRPPPRPPPIPPPPKKDSKMSKGLPPPPPPPPPPSLRASSPYWS
mmetsp:Transcript_3399/g.11133  ORF Transcript_3399/g.11133 Transcript_3399/m.11133 type:complete len:245 (+) Transcript_3399:343-1077(+)